MPGSAHPARIDVGFSLGELVGAPAATRTALLDRAQSAGATSIRFDLAWSTVQPHDADSYDWSTIDDVVSALRARGLRLLPVIGYTPAWARSPGCAVTTCPPASSTAFSQFVSAVVRRYAGPDIVAWEIWNEPNAGSWSPSPDPIRYAALLRSAGDAVHATSSSAPVLLGGLAPATTTATSMAPADFLSRVYASGAGDHFDGVAMHPYSFPALPGEGQAWSGWTQMLAVHAEQVAAGHGDQGVWATEFGTPTTGDGVEASASDRRYAEHPDHTDTALQAATVTSAFAQLPSLPWLRSLIWYSVVDLSSGADDLRGYGLVTGDGTPKPAFAAWQRSVGALLSSP